jgi:hypothetical protein
LLTLCPPGGAINVGTIILKQVGLNTSHAIAIAQLLGKFETLEALDLSGNGALGTSGAARLVGGLGRGVKSVSLKGTELRLAVGLQNLRQNALACIGEDWTRLEGALGGLAALEAIDLSENGALGTSGAARLVEGLGRGVKSVSLNGTGLGLAAEQGSQPGMSYGRYCGRLPARLACGDEDWTRLEGALGGLAALEAIDLSENGALGTSGVGRLVSSCAGELVACVIWFVVLFPLSCG